MCNPASIKGLLLNKNLKTVSSPASNSGEKGTTEDKTNNEAKTNKIVYLI